jgi:hypothetical protein
MPTTLASFQNAYRIALQLSDASGENQYIIHTECPLQPVRVISTSKTDTAALIKGVRVIATITATAHAA